jgi:hypothetical protein
LAEALVVQVHDERAAPEPSADSGFEFVDLREFEEIDTLVETRTPDAPQPEAPPIRRSASPPPLVSLAPTVLEGTRDRAAPRARTVLAGALAAAGLLAIVWSSSGARNETDPTPRSAAAPASVPRANAAAAAMIPPPTPPTAASAVQPARPAAQAEPPRPAVRSAEVAEERPRSRRRVARDLPAPSSPPEPARRESARLSIEELIDTRR